MMDVTITKTALDALDAKLSFSSVGYDPTRLFEKEPASKTSKRIHEEIDSTLYTKLLKLMAQALQQQDDDDNTEEDNHKNTAVIEKPLRIKRQTPLINAGYATRVAIITHTIQRFVAQQTTHLNIILLGCGFDVLGLWAHSLAHSHNIYTYEVDAYENATKKGYALKRISHLRQMMQKEKQQQQHDWDMNEIIHHPAQVDNHVVFQACISTSGTASCIQLMKPTNYTLFHADLRDITSLHQGFQETALDVSLPTLVISELVLAYLGTPTKMDQLLLYISKHLCVCKDSMMLCYEPMGSTDHPLDSPTSSTVLSVLDGYATDYFQHFIEKLDRNSSSRRRIEPDLLGVHRFQCIGTNPTIICNRLRACGFDGPVDCCNTGQAAASLDWKLNSQDIFDEYTALFMHLSCYGVLVAYSSSQRNMTSFRQICPWSVTSRALKGSGVQRIQHFTFKKNSPIDSSKYPEFCISMISAQDEAQVRMQFENTYLQLLDTYPSIKKMVKNALKTDLSSESPSSPDNIIHTKSSIRYSKIRDYYMNLDGAFWVATVSLLHTDHPTIHTESDQNTDERRRVIGFMGIRTAGSVKSNDISLTGIQRYEIMRLVVCQDWRNLGVGKALVSVAQDFVRQRLDPGSDDPAILMATTPSILDDANVLYSSLGFEIVYEVNQSGLLMKTYHLPMTRA